jgi:Uma2 family endonuclease
MAAAIMARGVKEAGQRTIAHGNTVIISLQTTSFQRTAAELHPSAEEAYRMVMALATGTWTVAERDRLPDDGNRYEVVDGELFVTPMPVPRHQQIVKRLFLLLHDYVEKHGLGSVFESGTDVIFSPRDVVIPDVVGYPFRDDQLPATWKDAPKPMLVVEVRSESTWRRDVGPKRRLYVRGEVPEYWIVDGEERTVTVVRPGHEDVRIADVLMWSAAGAKRALEIPLPELFR